MRSDMLGCLGTVLASVGIVLALDEARTNPRYELTSIASSLAHDLGVPLLDDQPGNEAGRG